MHNVCHNYVHSTFYVLVQSPSFASSSYLNTAIVKPLQASCLCGLWNVLINKLFHFLIFSFSKHFTKCSHIANCWYEISRNAVQKRFNHCHCLRVRVLILGDANSPRGGGVTVYMEQNNAGMLLCHTLPGW